MIQSILLCGVLLFAFAEPGCEVTPSDAKEQSDRKANPDKIYPGESPDTKTQYEPAPTPTYNEPAPTFEPKEGGEQ